MLVGLQYERLWLKGPLKLIYSNCLIRLNISSENNDFGFNRIQKINFSEKNPHLNVLGSKFDLDVK